MKTNLLSVNGVMIYLLNFTILDSWINCIIINTVEGIIKSNDDNAVSIMHLMIHNNSGSDYSSFIRIQA